MSDKRVYVERRSQGDYAIRRAGSERASAVEPTQAEAIQRARELNPGVAPHVERIRDTSVGGRDDLIAKEESGRKEHFRTCSKRGLVIAAAAVPPAMEVVRMWCAA